MRNKQKCTIILICFLLHYLLIKKKTIKICTRSSALFSVKQIMLYSLNGILYSTLQIDNTDLHLFNEYLYYMNKAN